MKYLPVLLLILLAACSTQWEGDPEIYGFALDIQLTQHTTKWLLQDDIKPRIRNVVEMSSTYWGIDPQEVSGWRLLLAEGLIHCGSRSNASGCTTTDDRTVSIASNLYVCIESSTLMHEIGHIALGDSGHHDPRWHSDAAIRALWAQMHTGLPAHPDCGEEPYRGQWQGF